MSIMGLSPAVIVFLLFAVLLAVGILAAVALPRLREGDNDSDGDGHRHTSRTGR